MLCEFSYLAWKFKRGVLGWLHIRPRPPVNTRLGSLEEVAFEEAGHAVMANQLGCRVMGIEIIEYTEIQFSRRYSGSAWICGDQGDASPKIGLAGPLAATRRGGHKLVPGIQLGGFIDAFRAFELIRKLHPENANAEIQIQAEVIAFVQDPVNWTRVERLADAIQQRRSLSRKEIEALTLM